MRMRKVFQVPKPSGSEDEITTNLTNNNNLSKFIHSVKEKEKRRKKKPLEDRLPRLSQSPFPIATSAPSTRIRIRIFLKTKVFFYPFSKT